MQFLKTLFWVLIAVFAVLFGTHNWTPVTVNLWAGLVWDTKLPFLHAIAFLIGFLPTWAVQRARIWSLRRRLDTLERNRVAAVAPASDDVREEATP
jgi:uncharacterized integral membrane protein